MARAGRSFEEGRIYHVYNRVGGGSKAFTDEELAATSVALLRLAMGRDGAAVLAWCLLGNHYHLVVRQGPVELSRPMKTLQQGVTRARNLRCRVFGPLWQGRSMARRQSGSRGRRWSLRHRGRPLRCAAGLEAVGEYQGSWIYRCCGGLFAGTAGNRDPVPLLE